MYIANINNYFFYILITSTVYPPTITKHPDDVKPVVYKSASFVCTAHGFGLIKIVWKRVNYSLPITANVTEEKSLNKLTSTLKISDIVGYYSGQYYCVAENKFGKTNSQIANLHVKNSKVDYNCTIILSNTMATAS